jgi:hypothetical protein
MEKINKHERERRYVDKKYQNKPFRRKSEEPRVLFHSFFFSNNEVIIYNLHLAWTVQSFVAKKQSM